MEKTLGRQQVKGHGCISRPGSYCRDLGCPRSSETSRLSMPTLPLLCSGKAGCSGQGRPRQTARCERDDGLSGCQATGRIPAVDWWNHRHRRPGKLLHPTPQCHDPGLADPTCMEALGDQADVQETPSSGLGTISSPRPIGAAHWPERLNTPGHDSGPVVIHEDPSNAHVGGQSGGGRGRFATAD